MSAHALSLLIHNPKEPGLRYQRRVALGGAVAAAVSMLVFPERAHKLGVEAASRILRDMAGLLPTVLGAFTHTADLNSIRRLQDDLGRAVGAR